MESGADLRRHHVWHAQFHRLDHMWERAEVEEEEEEEGLFKANALN